MSAWRRAGRQARCGGIKFAHGTGALTPLLHAQAALTRARLDLLTAQQEARLAALALRRAIGLPHP